MQMMRRVVVTGLGLVTPLGSSVEPVWRRLIAGESGIDRIQAFDVSDISSQIGGEIALGKEPGQLDLDTVLPPKDQRKTDAFILYAMAAANQAVADSG